MPRPFAFPDPYIAFTYALRRARKGSPAHYAIATSHLVLLSTHAVIAPRRPRRYPGVKKMDVLRRAVAGVKSEPLRLLLGAILDSLSESVQPDRTLEALMTLAQRLSRIARFDLAIAVYRQIVEYAASSPGFDLATAYNRLAYCLRESGDFEGAERELDRGVAWCERYGELPSAMLLKIARANLARILGKMAEARYALDRLLDGARTLGDQRVISRAAHDRGVVANASDEYGEALSFFEIALTAVALRARAGDASAHDAHSRLLNDIGLALSNIGLHEHARRAHLTVFLTAPERETRWSACINLLRLAAADGYRDAFDQYRRTLDRTPLPARLRTVYLLELGDGLTAFGDVAEGHDVYLRLRRLAERHGMHRYAERAFEALRGTRQAPSPRAARHDTVPPELEGLVGEVARLSELPCRLAPGRAFGPPPGTLATKLRRGRRPVVSGR